MMRWAYKVELSSTTEYNRRYRPETTPEAVLERLGREGWELVQVVVEGNWQTLYLKRPIRVKEVVRE